MTKIDDTIRTLKRLLAVAELRETDDDARHNEAAAAALTMVQMAKKRRIRIVFDAEERGPGAIPGAYYQNPPTPEPPGHYRNPPRPPAARQEPHVEYTWNAHTRQKEPASAQDRFWDDVFRTVRERVNASVNDAADAAAYAHYRQPNVPPPGPAPVREHVHPRKPPPSSPPVDGRKFARILWDRPALLCCKCWSAVHSGQWVWVRRAAPGSGSEYNRNVVTHEQCGAPAEEVVSW